jgi:glycosyltransferase involved in cell wall biosynthesis
MIVSVPHVVHVIDELPPDGAERLVVDVLKSRSGRYRYSVLCLIQGGLLAQEIEDMGIPVSILGRRGKWDFSFPWRLIRWLRNEKVAVVHTHLFTADAWGRLAAFLASTPGIFTTVHSTNQWKGRVHRLVDRALAYVSTKVIGCSEEVGLVLRQRDRLPVSRLVEIPNGIELTRFENVSSDGVRGEFRVPDSARLLGVLGRLHPAKGHEDLLKALATLPGDWRCLFIGGGELEEKLRAETDRLNLSGKVIFTGLRRDVPRLLSALNILVMPSRWEGLPMALLEAMAMGKAIVATRVGGIPDVVTHDEQALLVPPNDPLALQAALQRLFVDPELGPRLGEKARARVRAHYNVARTASAYEALYDAALKK